MRTPRVATRFIFSIVIAIVLTIDSVQPALATASYFYAGYVSSGYYLGVDGYILQTTTTTLTSPQHHADWINVCEQNNCNQWVQTGTYQGYLPNTSSPSAVHIYHENTDQCLRYHQGDDGSPASPDYPYYLTYDGTGSHQQTCSSGPSTFYVFDYRKGSYANAPFYYGQIGSLNGVIFAKTEIYPSQSVPLATDYYGCKGDLTCTNSSYGLHLYNGAWSLWTSDANSVYDLPPYISPLQLWWSFKTCPTSRC